MRHDHEFERQMKIAESIRKKNQKALAMFAKS